jgi:hypothetical protein
MAATGFTPIQLYRTSTTGTSPTAGNLTAGELAINYNTADMSVWALNTGGSVIRLMNNPAGLKYPTTDGTANQVMVTNGSGVLSWAAGPSGTYLPLAGGTMTGNITFNAGQTFTGTASTATNIAGGSNGTIPYQSAAGTTQMLAVGTAGQVLQTNGVGAPTWVTPSAGGITMGTPVASTSGTAITFTGIPSGTKRITIMLVGVSTDGTSEKQIQIGDSGGLESTGYLSVGIKTTTGGASTGGVSGNGFVIFSEASADVLSGSVILSLENSSTNSWVAQGLLQGRVGSNATYIVTGNKSLSGVLTQVSVNTPAANNFDAGEINILYE